MTLVQCPSSLKVPQQSIEPLSFGILLCVQSLCAFEALSGNLTACFILNSTTGCRGNVDVDASLTSYPEMRLLQLNGWRVLLLHIAGMPPNTTPACVKMIETHKPDIVVFGHSHKHGVSQHNGVLYVNPGSAGTCSMPWPDSNTRDKYSQHTRSLCAHMCKAHNCAPDVHTATTQSTYCKLSEAHSLPLAIQQKYSLMQGLHALSCRGLLQS